jgi:hypothetical protein
VPQSHGEKKAYSFSYQKEIVAWRTLEKNDQENDWLISFYDKIKNYGWIIVN